MLGSNITQISNLIKEFDKEGKSSTLELEAKFGRYYDRFFSDVPYPHYKRLIDRLRESPLTKSEVIEESTVRSFPGGYRRIVTTKENGEEVIWQKKQNIKNIDIREYDIRISMNIETDFFGDLTLLKQEVAQNNQIDLTSVRDVINRDIDIRNNRIPNNVALSNDVVTRERTRHSFLMKNDIIKVDITFVMMTVERVISRSYEVEVEYLGKANTLQIFEEYISIIFKLLKGTNNIFTNTDKNNLIRAAKAMLGDRSKTNSINKSTLVEARNIKKRDIVFGGIVGNTSIINKRLLTRSANRKQSRNGTSYMITTKADGLHKMLIIFNGIWLVYGLFEYNLVVSSDTLTPAFFRSYNNTILDGELVAPKVKINSNLWYLSYDCLVFQGKDKRASNLLERRKFAESVSKYLKLADILVDLKEGNEITTPEDFFRLTNKYLDARKNLNYAEDGLMFTPIDIIYNPMSQKELHKNRVLTKIPDVCKWKEVVTIDFSIKWGNPQRLELYSYDSDKEEEVPFIGTLYNPFDVSMIDYNNELTLNVSTDTVVEYYWDTKILKLIPIRIRYDKRGPNTLVVAQDNWDDIMNPVTEDDIRGKSLSLVFSYFNRIKSDLYSKLGAVNLLDIGSGKGGDVAKWLRLGNKQQDKGFVIAVEPNQNNRVELHRRIKLNKIEDKVFVEPIGGEDTVAITASVQKNIPGGKVDVISLMLSLSFFWKDELYLDSLVNTIVTNLKPGGSIIFLTIDGDTIEQIFDQKGITDLTLLTAKIHLYPRQPNSFTRDVDFFLPDTIVGEQREYIVHLKDLVTKLEKYNIKLVSYHRADQEQLLSEEAKIFSLLYSYGKFVRENINDVTDKFSKISLISSNKDTYLRSLPVTYLENQRIIFGPAKGDDVSLPLKCTWYNDLVRIATIGDGSCFVHAILKGFYKPYQENNLASSRLDLAAKIRRDLAIYLSYPDNKYPNLTLWDTTAKGSFPRILMQQIANESLVEVIRADFSLFGLQRLFNSYSTLGEESYSFISDSLDIDVYIFRATSEDIYPHSHTRKPEISRNAVVIIGNTSHYEVVGLNTPQGIQTLFAPDDPFLRSVIERYIGGGSFADIINITPYDPEQTFIVEFANTLVQNGEIIRPDLFNILSEKDPFIIMTKRLLPQILEYSRNNL